MRKTERKPRPDVRYLIEFKKQTTKNLDPYRIKEEVKTSYPKKINFKNQLFKNQIIVTFIT